MLSLTCPASIDSVTRLRAGDAVAVSGLVHTGRDRFHKRLTETSESRVDLRDGAIFHCGPIVAPDPWRVIAAGPTTSIREEPYMPRIIAERGVRVIIGKGGMGDATIAACREYGCVYLQAVGGAAALIARSVKRVVAVNYLDEFGATEAVWTLEISNLETVCAIDTLGASLHKNIKNASAKSFATIKGSTVNG